MITSKDMTTPLLTAVGIITGFFTVSILYAQETDVRPNVLFIAVDDLRPG